MGWLNKIRTRFTGIRTKDAERVRYLVKKYDAGRFAGVYQQRTHEDAITALRLYALGRDIKLAYKPGVTPWDILKRPTTTLANTVFLGVGYEDKKPIAKIELLAHELSHALTYRDIGFMRFVTKWVASRRFRFVYELAPLIVGLKAAAAHGLKIRVEQELDLFLEFYRLGSLPKAKSWARRLIREAKE
jgi:hypothetical protein